ncbi:MAG: hypothetical protein SFU91_12820 [Chloroherpetonaceae bacterium]|nr:hypothetical protein [Chloroherpetonaceae bacterium]
MSKFYRNQKSFKRLTSLHLLFFFAISVYSQTLPPPGQSASPEAGVTSSMTPYDAFGVFNAVSNPQAFVGGLGITTFGDKVYYTFNMSPDIGLGKIGIGFDLNLRFGTDGTLRAEDWEDGISSYLRIIRYVRYGLKDQDSLYIRVGQLDATRLGHGTTVFMYRNNASYDARRIGIEFDLDLGNFGFESFINDVSTFGLVGFRGFYRPLTSLSIPIIKDLEVGATFAGDFRNRTNLITNGISNRSQINGQTPFNFITATDNGSFIAYGVDLGLPLLRLPMISSDLYADFVKYANYGSGAAIGVNVSINAIANVLVLSSRFEHRVIGNQFQFAYFDALYEQDRFRATSGDSVGVTRANEIAALVSPGDGFYIDLGGSILNTIRLLGSYQRLYNSGRGGQLHLAARLDQAIPNVVLRADYYKRDLGFETEIFTLDDRSLATAELGYMPMPYLLVSLFYSWTFEPIRDGSSIIRYDPIRRLEPRVTFNFTF